MLGKNTFLLVIQTLDWKHGGTLAEILSQDGMLNEKTARLCLMQKCSKCHYIDERWGNIHQSCSGLLAMTQYRCK